MLNSKNWNRLLKSHLYSRKEFKNGVWRYYYDKNNNFGRATQCKSNTLHFKIDKNLSEEKQVEQVRKQALDYVNNVWLADWKNTTPKDKSICKELRNKKIVFEGISLYHIGNQGKNSKGGNKKRTLFNILDHSKYLPCAKEMLEDNGIWTHARYEPLEKPIKDKSNGKIIVANVYQTLTGKAPKGDSNNYVQVTVSKKKYLGGTYGNTVYISVIGVKNIKKSTFLLERCYKKGKSTMRGLNTLGSGSSYQFPKTIKSYTTDVPPTSLSIRGGKANYPLCQDLHSQTCKNSLNKPMYDGQALFGKSFIFRVTDLTENNRFKKFEQLEKALTYMSERKPFVVNHVGLDGSKRLQDVTLQITDFSTEKIEKALRTMAMSLDVPLKSSKGEVFYYHSQEELTNKWVAFFTSFVKDCYEFITDYFDLPKKTQMTKSVLRYKGKILYQPEAGTPIKQKDFDKFVKTLEDFLNRNKEKSEQIVLSSQALGKILNRMLKTNKLKDVKNADLKGLSFKGKSIDWISESTKNFGKIFELNRNELARLETLKQSSTIHITNITDKMRNTVKQILIDGVSGRKSKSDISQELFDKMVGDCRDFQRLADTEVQNNFNNAFIKDEVNNAEKGEKIYFQRLEVVDGNTCDRCKKLNGKIALWCDKPQKTEIADDKIADYYIWEGKEWAGKNDKVCIGALHPMCRGTWVRYYEDTAKIDKLISGEK